MEQVMSCLDDLPEEILVMIVCGVEHDDLKSLFFVSKAIREATLTAKESYFDYTTPKKTVLEFRTAENLDRLVEIEVQNAPKQSRVLRKRLSVEELADITVNLFPFDDDL